MVARPSPGAQPAHTPLLTAHRSAFAVAPVAFVVAASVSSAGAWSSHHGCPVSVGVRFGLLFRRDGEVRKVSTEVRKEDICVGDLDQSLK